MKSERIYLQHILECTIKLQDYASLSRDEFLASGMAQDATLRQLQVMAESTQRLSTDLKAKHPEVDWRALAGLRNVLVHDYLGIDMERVYRDIHANLPALKSAVESEIDAN